MQFQLQIRNILNFAILMFIGNRWSENSDKYEGEIRWENKTIDTVSKLQRLSQIKKWKL